MFGGEVNEDIKGTATKYKKCSSIFKGSKIIVHTCEDWQCINAHNCGIFLHKNCALGLVDTFSKWPEVHFTTIDYATLMIKALGKMSNRERVAHESVTDNRTYFVT